MSDLALPATQTFAAFGVTKAQAMLYLALRLYEAHMEPVITQDLTWERLEAARVIDGTLDREGRPLWRVECQAVSR